MTFSWSPVKMAGNEQEYSLNSTKVRNYAFSRADNTTLKTLDEFRKIGEYCDVVIRVHDVDYPAHSGVLAAESPFMKTLLGRSDEDPWAHSEANPITLQMNVEDISIADDEEHTGVHRAMNAILSYIYTSTIVAQTDILPAVETIAKLFELDSILKFCEAVPTICSPKSRRKSTNIITPKNSNDQDITSCLENTPPEEQEVMQESESMEYGNPENCIILGTPGMGEMQVEYCDDDDDDDAFGYASYAGIVADGDYFKDNPDDILIEPGSRDDIPVDARAFIQYGTISTFFHNVITICRKPGTKHGQGRNLVYHKCVHCDFEVEQYTRCLQHQTKHFGNMFHCDQCDAQYGSRNLSVFRQHLKEHAVKPNQCTWRYCQFVAINRSEYEEHQAKHTGTEPHVCLTCDKRFAHKTWWKCHNLNHTDVKQYECGTCGAKFKQSGNLSNHMKVHSDIKPFLCDLCGFASKYKQRLQEHYRIHTGEMFVCPVEGCGYQTGKEFVLKKHEIVHTKIRAYMCDECGSHFSTSVALKRHQYIHTGERPFQCSLCDFATTRKDYLNKHIASHHQIPQ